MNAGLDIGYNATKGKTDGPPFNILSTVGTPNRARFSLNGHNDFLITINGKQKQIGESAVRQSHSQSHSEDRGWISTEKYYYLFLAALTELSTANWVELTIVTGLPVKFYEDDAPILKQVMRGEHRAKRVGRHTQTFKVVKVVPIPQPFGTVASEVLDNGGKIINPTLANGEGAVFDVGGKTTNILDVYKLSEINHGTTSIDKGGWDIARQVGNYLADNYPDLGELRDHQIAEIVKQRSVNYHKKTVDLGPIIDDIIEPVAEEITDKANHLWKGKRSFDDTLITGGGAYLLGQHIIRRYPSARIVDSPVYANAIGYWKLSQRLK